MYRLWNFCLRK